jgi:hypothetical protein
MDNSYGADYMRFSRTAKFHGAFNSVRDNAWIEILGGLPWHVFYGK